MAKKQIVTPKIAVPTWGDLQRMAAEIKRVLGKPGDKLTGETYMTLLYLDAIVVDDQANKSPIHG